MDVIGTPDGPKVVDVNDFPGYKAVPDAAVAVADYIERFATRWCSLQPPEMVVPNGTATHTADQQACSPGPARVLTEHRLPKPATPTI